jgi:hypothetical protein
MSVSINGTNGLVFNDGSTQATAASGFGFKNRIINGAMVIDQRNAGASVNLVSSGNTFIVDRFFGYAAQNSKLTAQQNAGGLTGANLPTGFRNYIGATSSATWTAGASESFVLGQTVEGFNTSDLGFGAAGAVSVTLSFWVRSSLTGTFSGSISNGAADRSYVFTFTVSAANTWEQKSVTIAGDTSGTWVGATNGLGLRLYFDLGCGTSSRTTAGSWASGFYLGATGANSLGSASGATFYVTGVQLEKGSTATSFDVRPYGTELALCQRYYWQINSETSYAGLGSGVMVSGSQARIFMPYPVPMRAAPTVSGTSLSSLRISQSADITPTNLTPYANSRTCMFDMATSGGTTGAGAVLIFNNLSTGSIQATAEL